MALIAFDSNLREGYVADHFLDDPNEESFTELFKIFTPQLVAFFRRRGHELVLAEDLAQEVMLTVYRKAQQIRDRTLFSRVAFQNCAQRRLPALRQAYPGGAHGCPGGYG